jgi:sugar lactone lactonase YvrE
MAAPEVECVLTAGASLGECPVWSSEEKVLYWVDIDGRAVHAFDPATGVDRSWPLDGRPGAIALTDDISVLLVAVENELGWLSLESGEVTQWQVLEESRPGVRLNDGRCDPAGRFWVGGMFVPTSARRFEAWLHRIEHDGSSVTTRGKVGVSNGLAFSPDGTVMYWADTLHETVWAYDYDVSTGEQHNERVFLDFAPLPGRPDGACIDETGCYWIACVGGSALLRITPQGVVDRNIPVPVPRPTMPAFGGADLDTLFVTTIGRRPGDAGGSGHPGGIYAFEPGVRGLKEPRFGG